MTLTTAKTDTTALALLGTMLLALAIGAGAYLADGRSSALRDIVQVVGIGRTSAIETEQRRQLATIAELERTVQAVSSELAGMNARIAGADRQDSHVADRFALVEADIGALVAELRNLRAAARQAEPAAMSGPVADHLNNAVTAAQSDIAALRSSIDEQDRTSREKIDAIANRLDRVERQLATRDLTGSIRPVSRKKIVKRKMRPVGAARPAGDKNDMWHRAAAHATTFSWTYPGPAQP
jgi:chromosome segregation ATPase